MAEFKSGNVPLISIILPTYNGEKYIRATIESVLSQTVQNFELIILDDASEDATPEILREFSSNSRLRIFIFKKNVGQAKNWNRGIHNAKGRYIKFLGQDDLIQTNYLEEAVSILEQNSTVSLVCSFEKPIGTGYPDRNLNVMPGKGEISGVFVQKNLLENGNWIGGPTAVMCRTDVFKHIGGFDTNLKCSLDYGLWIRILSTGNLYVLPHYLYGCRTHNEQETNKCKKNLGFLKDKIFITQKLIDQPKLYRGGNSEHLKYLLRKRLLQLISKSIRYENIHIVEIIKYVRQYQSVLQTSVMLMQSVLFVILDLYKSKMQ